MSGISMNRRRWLQTTAGSMAVVGAAAAGADLEAQEYRLGGADIKLGIASYSFRNFPREKAIEMAKAGDGQMIKLLVDKVLATSKADDEQGDQQPKVQIMIGKLPERKEDITINGEQAK